MGVTTLAKDAVAYADGVHRRLEELYTKLAALPSLEPSNDANTVFTEIVQYAVDFRDNKKVVERLGCEKCLKSSCASQSLLNKIRALCADGEFRLERAWATRINESEDAALELAKFPYYGNYRDLTRLEIHAVLGVWTGLQPIESVAFVGSGPLPFSSILLADYLPTATIMNIDLDETAINLSQRLLQRLNLSDRLGLCQSDIINYQPLAEFDVVILAALVGSSRRVKQDILAHLGATMRKGSVLMARSAHGMRKMLYAEVEVEDVEAAGFRVQAVVHPYNHVANSVVVAILGEE